LRRINTNKLGYFGDQYEIPEYVRIVISTNEESEGLEVDGNFWQTM